MSRAEAEPAEFAMVELKQVAADAGVPTIEFGLMRSGDVLSRGTTGEAPLGQQFRIASMTKSFTAATVLALRDAGHLQLDDPVATYLPRLVRSRIAEEAPILRIRHLLTMTAGFPTDDPWGDRQEGLPLDEFDALAAVGFTACRVPGVAFEYSNLGYALLGRIIAAATGSSYADVVRETFLNPLGLADTTFDVRQTTRRALGYHPLAGGLIDQDEPLPGAFSPMGGLWSTVDDLARWVAFLSGTDDSLRTPLLPWSRAEMSSPQVFARLEAAPSECVAQSYGMGLYVAEHASTGRYIHHSGGYPGFGSHMRWHPASGWAIIALANRTYAPMGKACARILEEIVAATPGGPGDAPTVWPETEAAVDLATSLLVDWNDERLSAMASMNLDLDQPREERREVWQRIGRQRGPFVRGAVTCQTPAQAQWVMSGAGGDVRIEILMSPESPPRLQALRIDEVER